MEVEIYCIYIHICERWLNISCFWKTVPEKSQLIKTKVKEQRFVVVPLRALELEATAKHHILIGISNIS